MMIGLSRSIQAIMPNQAQPKIINRRHHRRHHPRRNLRRAAQQAAEAVPRHGNRLSPRRYRLSAGLQGRLRGHRLEAARLGVPLRPIEALGHDQEPGSAGSAARGGGGLGTLTHRIGPVRY
jgi:hypothetical protein